MAFEGLTEKLSAAFKKLRGKGRLSEADVKDAMREIRLALLEADVSYKVVKDFIKKTTERAVGTDVPRFRQGPEAPVHHPQGVTALLRQLPLAGEGPTGKDVQNIPLLPVHVQTSILFRERKVKKHLPTGENDFLLFYTAA